MTLGQFLRQKRIESGRTLEQISTHTKIHLKILNSIEEDSYADLPARTFTRGFIVNYARALGLSPDQIMSEYGSFLEGKFSERPSRDQGHQGYAFEGKEIEQNRRWLIVGASVTAAFAIAVLLIFKPQNHKRKEKHKEFEETPAVVAGDPAASPSVAPNFTGTPSQTAAASTPSASTAPKPSTTPKATATPKPSATPSASPGAKEDKLNKGDDIDPKEVKRKLSFHAKDDLWVRWKSDDRPAMSLLLRKGRFLVIKGREKIFFETNRPERIGVRLKNYAYENMPAPKLQAVGNGVEAYDGDELDDARLPDWLPAPVSPTPAQ